MNLVEKRRVEKYLNEYVDEESRQFFQSLQKEGNKEKAELSRSPVKETKELIDSYIVVKKEADAILKKINESGYSNTYLSAGQPNYKAFHYTGTTKAAKKQEEVKAKFYNWKRDAMLSLWAGGTDESDTFIKNFISGVKEIFK